eukprot:4221647-Prorocentrum_lima.AAC.1
MSNCCFTSIEAFVSTLPTWVWMSCTSCARTFLTDLNNFLVPEDQAHLDSRLATVLEDVIN